MSCSWTGMSICSRTGTWWTRIRMRVLIHQLPVRQQIELPVQEQLIVEYYSKK